MTGEDFYIACQSLINGFAIDQVIFYQMLNTARTRREFQRAWMKLRKYQYSQSLTPTQPSLTLPPNASADIPEDFMFFSRDGEITLYDNDNQYETYTEIPLNLLIPYLQVNNVFYMDHAASKIYFLGVIQKAYTAFIQYQADFGDITATTTWVNIPSRFHMILAYDVATMYRLGMDYDDINARNADRNNVDAEQLYNSMAVWDDNLQRSATTRMELPVITDVPGANFQHKINVGGYG